MWLSFSLGCKLHKEALTVIIHPFPSTALASSTGVGKLCLAGWIWPVGTSLLTSAVVHSKHGL